MTGMAPLHIAAQHGNEIQVELLVLNGADVCATDFEDRLPEHVAKEHRKLGLAARMTELRYQVTDKLTYFISAQRPSKCFLDIEIIRTLLGILSSSGAFRYFCCWYSGITAHI